MSLEGVTKDIKDGGQPMGKRDTMAKMGGENLGYKTNPAGVELALYILLITFGAKETSSPDGEFVTVCTWS